MKTNFIWSFYKETNRKEVDVITIPDKENTVVSIIAECRPIVTFFGLKLNKIVDEIIHAERFESKNSPAFLT